MSPILAACGNDCAACPRYVAPPYEKTEEELQHAAQLWHKIGYRDTVVSPREMACHGCKPENWCRYQVVQCCAEKGVAHCGQCPDYPCDTIRDCFTVTSSFIPQCRVACTPEEFRQMERAFFEKEKNLSAGRDSLTVKKMETAQETKGKAYVHWRCWQEVYPGLVSPDYLKGLTLEKCEEMAFAWPESILVALRDNRVIGFVGYGSSQEEDLPGAGEIFALYVLPQESGKGIGRRLLAAALKELGDRSPVCLWMLKENQKAFRFYQKCGFAPDGKEKFSPTVEAAGIRLIRRDREA